MPTQSERRAETRAALLAASWKRFADVGFDSTTIDELAAAAGMTRGAIYHHFTSKEALFEAVFEAVEQHLFDDVSQAVARHSGAPVLVGGAAAYIRFASDCSVARIVLVDGPAVLGPERYRAIDERYFLPLVTAALGAPGRSERVVTALGRAVFAAICELALHAYLSPDSESAITSALDELLSPLENASTSR